RDYAAARLARHRGRQAPRAAPQDRAHVPAAPLPAVLRPRQGDAEPAALRREGDAGVPAPGGADGGGLSGRNRRGKSRPSIARSPPAIRAMPASASETSPG